LAVADVDSVFTLKAEEKQMAPEDLALNDATTELRHWQEVLETGASLMPVDNTNALITKNQRPYGAEAKSYDRLTNKSPCKTLEDHAQPGGELPSGGLVVPDVVALPRGTFGQGAARGFWGGFSTRWVMFVVG
jgi:hypothetical protein